MQNQIQMKCEQNHFLQTSIRPIARKQTYQFRVVYAQIPRQQTYQFRLVYANIPHQQTYQLRLVYAQITQQIDILVQTGVRPISLDWYNPKFSANRHINLDFLNFLVSPKLYLFRHINLDWFTLKYLANRTRFVKANKIMNLTSINRNK